MTRGPRWWVGLLLAATLALSGCRSHQRASQPVMPLVGPESGEDIKAFAAALSRSNYARAAELAQAGHVLKERDESGRTPLHLVAALGGPGGVWRPDGNYEAYGLRGTPLMAQHPIFFLAEDLIEAGADLEAVDSQGNTPLLAAAQVAGAQMVTLLISKGANARAANSQGQTGLHLAAFAASADTVLALLGGKADANGADHEGNTPLHVAAREPSAEVVKYLLQAGAQVNARNGQGETPLHLCARTWHTVTARALLQAGADVNARGPGGATPLHVAAASAQLEMARLLIAQGASLQARDDQGRRPAQVVAASARPQLAALLGGQKQTQRTLDPALGQRLYEAAGHRDAETVRGLIGQGADPNWTGPDAQTPLHQAVEWQEKPEITRLLLDAGASPDARDAGLGETALHLALAKQHPEAAKLLIVRGADVNARDRRGRTPLHIAAEQGYADVAKMLLDRGALVDARTKDDGDTPLWQALAPGDLATVQLLVARGADVRAHPYRTITTMTEYTHQPEIRALLVAHGARPDN